MQTEMHRLVQGVEKIFFHNFLDNLRADKALLPSKIYVRASEDTL